MLLASLAASALIPSLVGRHGTVIGTGSMEPCIGPGDVVVLADLPVAQVVPDGGVVKFTSPADAQSEGVERSVLHRVVTDHEDGTYATAGDANADVDSIPMVREQITGQARLLEPFIGLPALWLGTGQHLPLGPWAAGTAALSARTGTCASGAAAAPPPITVGRASSFAILARTAVNENTLAGWFFSVNGDIGTIPAGSIKGVSSSEYSGTLHRNNPTSVNAMANALAYATALTVVLDARMATVNRSGTWDAPLTRGCRCVPPPWGRARRRRRCS